MPGAELRRRPGFHADLDARRFAVRSCRATRACRCRRRRNSSRWRKRNRANTRLPRPGRRRLLIWPACYSPSLPMSQLDRWSPIAAASRRCSDLHCWPCRYCNSSPYRRLCTLIQRRPGASAGRDRCQPQPRRCRMCRRSPRPGCPVMKRFCWQAHQCACRHVRQPIVTKAE